MIRCKRYSKSREVNGNFKEYMSSVFTNFANKVLPKDYEDYYNVCRSTISYNDLNLKQPALVSFVSQMDSEVR